MSDERIFTVGMNPLRQINYAYNKFIHKNDTVFDQVCINERLFTICTFDW